MEKIINIDGKDCVFKTSASIPRMYRLQFKRDIFLDLTKIQKAVEKAEKTKKDLPLEVLELFENIAYLMHRHGDNKQPKDIDKWLEQFDTFSIYQILPEILELWTGENLQLSTLKKNQER